MTPYALDMLGVNLTPKPSVNRKSEDANSKHVPNVNKNMSLKKYAMDLLGVEISS